MIRHGIVFAWVLSVFTLSVEALDISKLQATLKREKASWKAIDQSDRSLKAYRLGLKDKIRKDRTFDQTITPKSLTRSIDWRNKDGKNWLGAVRDQGRCGSCVAFAVVAAMESLYNIKSGQHDLNLDFSEQYLHALSANCETGALFRDSLNALNYWGIPDESCHPYISGRLGQDQWYSSACAEVRSRRISTSYWRYLYASELKAALKKGPVITGMFVFEDFFYYSEGIYEHKEGDLAGAHAVLVVGYNDREKYFIAKNSWGEDWGENGYFKIRYNSESGFGEENYLPVLQAIPDRLVKLESPSYLGVVKSNLPMKVNVIGDVLDGLNYRLKNTASASSVSGEIKPNIYSKDLSVSTARDGVYELRITQKNGSLKPGAAWYSRILVANKRPQLSLSLEPEFSASEPISERVYFQLKTQSEKLPLTHAKVVFEHLGSDDSHEVILADPGPLGKVGWRTKKHKNGQYRITAHGYIGDLYEWKTTPIKVTVSN